MWLVTKVLVNVIDQNQYVYETTTKIMEVWFFNFVRILVKHHMVLSPKLTQMLFVNSSCFLYEVKSVGLPTIKSVIGKTCKTKIA